MDGFISTASLMVGVAAAGTGRADILVAGVAGLVAGAMSMAAGEYVSVSSQADTEQADLTRERHELASALALLTVLGAVAARVGGAPMGRWPSPPPPAWGGCSVYRCREGSGPAITAGVLPHALEADVQLGLAELEQRVAQTPARGVLPVHRRFCGRMVESLMPSAPRARESVRHTAPHQKAHWLRRRTTPRRRKIACRRPPVACGSRESRRG